MQKSALLFILTAFFTGGALGYFHLFLHPQQQDSSLTSVEKETQWNGRASTPRLVRSDSSGSRSLPIGSNWNNFLLKYSGFSLEETRAELERLLKIKKDSKKHELILYPALRYLSFKLAFQSPDEAKRLLDDKSNKERNILYSSLLEGWAEKDFQGAMDYLLTHKTESSDSIEVFNTLTTSLVNRDTDKALKWVSTLTPGEREIALDTMASAISKLHPDKISEFLAVLTPEEQSSYSISTKLASNWAVADWDAFKAWADSLKKREQGYVFSSALQGLSRIDLAKATEKMRELGNKNSSDTARSIVYGMDYEDRKKGKALDWVMENKDYFSDLPSAMEKVASCSSFGNGPVLTDTILKLPEGEIRDAALSGMIDSQASVSWSSDDYNGNDKYTGLLDMAGKIGDSKKRDQMTLRCVEGWIYESPENARKWITEKSQLSSQVKDNLLKQCDSRQKEKDE